MVKFGMGQAIPRVEDRRLLTGGGRFTDDINLPGQARAVILRSPHAHARIVSVDVEEAARAPGVAAVYTGADVAGEGTADGLGHLPCLVPMMVPLTRPDGSPMYVPPRPALVADRVRFVGDYVAMVVAETVDQAKDAAEVIDVEYDDLPANTGTAAAVEPGVPAVWEACPDNICFAFEAGDEDAVDAAFKAADHVTSLTFPVSRIAVNPMEPRAALGAYDPHEERYTLYSGTQGPHDLRRFMAESILGVPEIRLRVVSPDMGGAFGMRSNTFPEMALVLWAAKKLGRPVKWTGERSEAFLSDDQGRDSIYTVELALDKDGTFLALRVNSIADFGAYLSIFGPFPSFGNLGGVAGVYRTPAIHARVRGVFTNTVPIGPYRGAGRPEAAMAIEQAVDLAAREMGIDRVELRRRNIVAPDAMPFKTGLTFTYDSGEFERNMDAALELADHAGFEARRAAAKRNGKLRGQGVANAIEQSAGVFDEGAELRFDADGGATLFMGTHSHGQGHETVFRQPLADKLGLDFDRVRYVQGDTDLVPYGHGTFGSRSSGLGGAALALAADVVIEKGRRIAAHGMEAGFDDIEFSDGRFSIAGTDRSMTLSEVARVAHSPALMPPGMDSGLQGFATFKPPAPTFPNGCHVCELEIDPATGVIDVLSYAVVDDVGTVMNPLLLKGQIHGGIVQGLGQILMEEVVWEPGSGQILTGSFMDYTMPRADDVPFFEVVSHEVPTSTNPLGIKGAGEAGSVGAMPCVISAIVDALAPLGIRSFDMPATPERVWQAIRAAV